MMSAGNKREALWQELVSRGLVSGELPPPDDTDSPWYVRLLIGFSAWLAAVFLLGFVGAAFEVIYDNPAMALVLGSVMLFLAYLMLEKNPHKDFASQFALAVSFAGQALVVYGLFEWGQSMKTSIWLVIALVQAGLAIVMPNSMHRTWSAFAAAMAFSLAFVSGHVFFVPTSLLMLAVAYLWLNEFKWIELHHKLKPIGYGLTLALLYQASTGIYSRLLMEFISGHGISIVPPWVGELLTGVVILYVVWQLLARQNIRFPGRVANAALAAAFILILTSLKMYGLGVGVMVILLGYANGNRILTGLGIVSLLYYISAYYYFMHTTLLEKSQWLALLGLVLLVASGLMRKVLFNNKEISDEK